jgi:hypothetical protein
LFVGFIATVERVFCSFPTIVAIFKTLSHQFPQWLFPASLHFNYRAQKYRISGVQSVELRLKLIDCNQMASNYRITWLNQREKFSFLSDMI